MTPEIPTCMRNLPLDKRGIPIPWFVADPVPGQEIDLRVACGKKREHAVDWNLSWCCGVPLGKYRVFIGGPLALANRGFSDWASHEACAVYAAQICPFLNGAMKKRPGKDYPEGTDLSLPGFVTQTLPVTCLYYVSARPGTIRRNPDGIFLPGKPSQMRFFKEGVEITHANALPLIVATLREQGFTDLDLKDAEIF